MSQSNEALAKILESAHRLGVEVDEADALQWLAAVSAGQASAGDVVVDARQGVYGHRVTMLDFNPDDLAHFRRVGSIVEMPDEPGVETALALSGSSAQSKIQTYPGDCDYFERVNIRAATREEAIRKLSEVMRNKILGKLKGPDYQFIYCRWGNAPQDIVKGGQPFKKGASLTWEPAEVQAGQFEAFTADGQPFTFRWSDAEADPGWCKLDWVVADSVRGQLAHASNVLDVTWEAPDGTIVPLDGFIDPYFQEVYLDAQSIPLFTKIVKQISADSLEDYVTQLQGEVRKWAAKPNWGKVAKRLYNIFRLSGQYPEAAYIRELFDEPATILYQVWSLIGTLEDFSTAGVALDVEPVLKQLDTLIKIVVDACEGPLETRIIMNLLQLKESLAGRGQMGEEFEKAVKSAQAAVVDLLNEYFRERLFALPAVAAYLEAAQQNKGAAGHA